MWRSFGITQRRSLQRKSLRLGWFASMNDCGGAGIDFLIQNSMVAVNQISKWPTKHVGFGVSEGHTGVDIGNSWLDFGS
jgi:hypothetical protein